MNASEIVRKTPSQRRSQISVDCVLEAAAQVLEATGKDGFNTNAVAERAGVSIGTLYRYFPNKRSILVALALREREAHKQAMVAAIAQDNSGIARDRLMIRAFVRAFAGRTQARRLSVTALLAEFDHRDLSDGSALATDGLTDASGQALNEIQTFVLSRAIHGAMRAAVLEGAEFLLSQEFEDELVRIGRAYLGYRPRTADAVQ